MRRIALATGLPLLLVLIVAAGFLSLDPLRAFRGAAPPVERLTVERTVLDDDGIRLWVRAGGSEPVTLAQVQVDGAYWVFSQAPTGPIPRLATASIQIPYPWIEGDTHHLVLLSRHGVPFAHTIEVATNTPGISAANFLPLTLVGVFVGVVPVALGMLFFPALRAGGAASFGFALALTLGLLAFLLVDTLSEALELAGEATQDLRLPILVWLTAGVAFMVLMAVGRARGAAPTDLSLATSIALGIGLHNLGEGLAIGSAFATGANALGSFLVLGFTLHNVTEGVGIVAPLLRQPPRPRAFVGLALLAGLPAVPGVWLGSYALAPHWAAIALSIGAGAILQVIVEVSLLLLRQRAARPTAWANIPVLGGLVLGMAIMLVTAWLVPA